MSSSFLAAMAAIEACAFENANDFLALETGKAGHIKICWTPTNSSELEVSPSLSRHNTTASRTRFISVSRVFA